MKICIPRLLSFIITITLGNLALRLIHAGQLPTIKQIYGDHGVQKEVDVSLPSGSKGKIEVGSKGKVYTIDENDHTESLIADIKVMRITRDGLVRASKIKGSDSIKIKIGDIVRFGSLTLPGDTGETLGKTPAARNRKLSESQQDKIGFFIPKQGEIRRTIIRAEDKQYQVDIIVLSIGLANETSSSTDINVSINIGLIHPEHPDVSFALLKKERGPHIVHLEPGEETFCALEYVQQPGTPILASQGRGFVFVSIPGGQILRVDLVRVLDDNR